MLHGPVQNHKSLSHSWRSGEGCWVLSPYAEHLQNVCTSNHEGFGTESTAEEAKKGAYNGVMDKI